MAGLDTNLLVRWLLDDDEDQSARVQRLFKVARSGRVTLFVPSSVALEFEWVLRSRYRFDKASVLQTFAALLETQELEFQVEAGLERALHMYRQGVAEFADCMHAGLCGAAGQSPLLTFDEKAARLSDVQLLD
jgi:predicted nucleic-acid-binding protein